MTLHAPLPAVPISAYFADPGLASACWPPCMHTCICLHSSPPHSTHAGMPPVPPMQVGGASEVEVNEKKDRITDALNATKVTALV